MSEREGVTEVARPTSSFSGEVAGAQRREATCSQRCCVSSPGWKGFRVHTSFFWDQQTLNSSRHPLSYLQEDLSVYSRVRRSTGRQASRSWLLWHPTKLPCIPPLGRKPESWVNPWCVRLVVGLEPSRWASGPVRGHRQPQNAV